MADRYWVGGSGNWSDNTNHWSDSTGGSPGATKPTSSDNVIFDTSSSVSNAAYTVTINEAADCLNFTMDGPDPADANKVTWAGSFALNVYGNLNLSGGTAGITMTYSNSLFLSATTTGKTITTNGISLTCGVYCYGSGGGWTLQDNLTLNGKTLGVLIGTFNANNKDLDIWNFESSETTARTITMGSGTWTIRTTNSVPWTTANTTNLTLNANTSTIKLVGALAVDLQFRGGGKTFYNLWNATTGAYAITLTGSNTFNDLKIDAGRTVKFTNSTTTTVTTFTALGTSGSHITISNTSSTTHATLAKAGGGVISGCDYIDIQEITGSPASTWYIGTNSTDVGSTCTNIYLSDGPAPAPAVVRRRFPGRVRS